MIYLCSFSVPITSIFEPSFTLAPGKSITFPLGVGKE
jgi:hypothetical protein